MFEISFVCLDQVDRACSCQFVVSVSIAISEFVKRQQAVVRNDLKLSRSTSHLSKSSDHHSSSRQNAHSPVTCVTVAAALAASQLISSGYQASNIHIKFIICGCSYLEEVLFLD